MPPRPKPVELPPERPDPGERRLRPRRWHNVILLVVSLLVVPLGFEGFYRVRRWLRNRDDERFTLDHNWLREIPRPGWSSSTGRIHINSLGFRGEEVERTKPPGTTRIVCLGGSTTFGFYLHDDTAWPGQLQERLRKAFPKRRIEVINAACPGYNTYISYVNLRTRLIHLQPDIAIICHLHNDAQHAIVNRIAVNKRIDPDAWYPNLMDREGFDSWVWRSLLVDRILDRVSRRKSMTSKEFESLYPSILDQYDHNMRSLVLFCKKVGVKPILSTYAHWIDPKLGERELQKRAAATLRNFRFLDILQSLRLYHDFNEAVRKIGEDLGVPVVDNARLVPPREELFRDSVHFTEAGASLVADNVLEVVGPMVVGPSSAPSGTPASGSARPARGGHGG